ncbi:hypothetical protein ACFVH9_34780 [Streptomyces hirsutus]|uniref:hypothetical protein n=1 Tax=Streptomyces hirsutus TaxID=35620 RepID=UPI00363081AB
MMAVALITAGQMHHCCLRQVLADDGHRPAGKPLKKVQQDAGVPAGRWMGRGLTLLGPRSVRR